MDPHTGVQLQEVTATISKDLVFEYFGKSPFKCDCHAWSPRGKAKSQSATIEVACKFSIHFSLFLTLFLRYIQFFFLFRHFILIFTTQFNSTFNAIFTHSHMESLMVMGAFVWHVFSLTLICKMLKIHDMCVCVCAG